MPSASGLQGSSAVGSCSEVGLLCTISNGRSGLGVTGGKGQSTAMCWVWVDLAVCDGGVKAQ